MNIMEFVYNDSGAHVAADVLKSTYGEMMQSVLHETLCILDPKYAAIKFVVVNGIPYAEWVDHTADEWKIIVHELAMRKLDGMIVDMVHRLFEGNEDDEQHP